MDTLKAFSNSLKEKIALRVDHRLTKQDRIAIFEEIAKLEGTKSASFEHSTTIKWLAILTGYKILPIWENASIFSVSSKNRYYDYREMLGEMLVLAEQVITGKVTPHNAGRELNTTYFSWPNYLKNNTTRTEYSARLAIYAILGILVSGLDEKMVWDDFACLACDAFAGIDENEPGSWNDEDITSITDILFHFLPEHLDKNASFSKWQTELNLFELLEYFDFDYSILQQKLPQAKLELITTYKPFRRDCTKELQFWDWWLVEAIPQAWELAHSALDSNLTL